MAASTGAFAPVPIAQAGGGDLATLILGSCKLLVFWILSCTLS